MKARQQLDLGRAGSAKPAGMETTLAKNIANYFDRNAVSEGVERARVRLGLESATVPADAWASVHRMGAFLAFQKPSLRCPAEKPITCKQQHRGQPVPIFFNRAHARHTQSGEIGEVDGPQPAQTALSLPLFRWSSSTSHFARATPNSHSFPGAPAGVKDGPTSTQSPAAAGGDRGSENFLSALHQRAAHTEV